ncbi:YlmC/YmxH family sporulation protein [Gorillibacterium massiliense]|uniref:YlmC/YmxH family sporulation protein n=1 Tax=Gorillibacterium massiliense TaxID=1280390 RepID=UPI0006942B52|nr:YlmC/YmxH family sporulation protein [Gorillibacterium massiliense]
MKISDFQSKDVVNIIDGKKLGQISDLELDLRQGRIEAIVVPNHTRFFGMFGGGTDVVIPWRNIVKIGMDVVLVKLDDTRVYRNSEEDAPAEYIRPYREKEQRERERERDRDR